MAQPYNLTAEDLEQVAKFAEGLDALSIRTGVMLNGRFTVDVADHIYALEGRWNPDQEGYTFGASA